MKTIGEKIKDLRTKKKIRQKHLAKAARITPEYLSHVESGRRSNLTIDTIKRISEALDVKPHELII